MGNNVLEINNANELGALNQMLSRQQVLVKLKELSEIGYQHVVREKDMNYLLCFSLKPKKYLDDNIWGYVNPDKPNVMMAYPIKNTDIKEINWSNRSATLISDFLSKAKE